MCLIVVKQCKKMGISTEEGGVSIDVCEALNPFDVSMPPRRRPPKMQVRRKEVESNIDVVPITLDSDDVAWDVATIQIEHAKAIKTWIQTPGKHFSR